MDKNAGRDRDTYMPEPWDEWPVLEKLRHPWDDERGFKDLKEEKNRAFMEGMAMMHFVIDQMRIEEENDDEDGMTILEQIDHQCRLKLLKECKAWMVGGMTEKLEILLDREEKEQLAREGLTEQNQIKRVQEEG